MKNHRKTSALNTRNLVLLGILTAGVAVLQMLGAFIRFGPFSISLVLMPIAVGAALMGPYAGAWLGLVFGGIVLMSGDANIFIAINPFGAVAMVLLKGALAGLLTGFVYRLLDGKSKTAAAIVAGAVCPVVNTGVFILGVYAFFLPAITIEAQIAGFANVAGYIIVGIVGLNFLIELALNLILSPVIVRLIQFGRSR